MSMTLIATTTLASATAEISFSSIAGTYTDLLLVLNGRGDRTATFTSSFLKLNTSNANFTTRTLSGNGSSASSSTDPQSYFGYVPCASATSNTFSNDAIYIPNYAGSTNKSVSVDSVAESNATQAFSRLSALLWSQTAAITGVSVYLDTSNFVAGSTASLYGILKGSGGATVSP